MSATREQLIEEAMEKLEDNALGIEDGKPYVNKYWAARILDLLIERAADLVPNG